jgi:hypothetical protein
MWLCGVIFFFLQALRNTASCKLAAPWCVRLCGAVEICVGVCAPLVSRTGASVANSSSRCSAAADEDACRLQVGQN